MRLGSASGLWTLLLLLLLMESYLEAKRFKVCRGKGCKKMKRKPPKPKPRCVPASEQCAAIFNGFSTTEQIADGLIVDLMTWRSDFYSEALEISDRLSSVESKLNQLYQYYGIQIHSSGMGPGPPDFGTGDGPFSSPSPSQVGLPVLGQSGVQGGITLFRCDLEVDLCGMTQGINAFDDDLDWTRHIGSTVTSNTGPTSAAEGDYYLYLETDSTNHNQTATLRVDVTMSSAGEACISFMSHMFGDAIGTLTVMTNSGDVWSKSGTQGDQWNPIMVDVMLDDWDTITFRAQTHGTSSDLHLGDIAIDDIHVSTGLCAGGFYCGFENDFCGMTQRTDDEFDWQLMSGPTDSSGTGPNMAYRGSAYTYSEASVPQMADDVASIETPTLNYTGDVCVSFFYHMNGSSMGNLRGYKESTNETLWTTQGNQGDQWLPAFAPATLSAPDKFGFSAVRGPDIESDIAIDELKVSYGSCEVEGILLPSRDFLYLLVREAQTYQDNMTYVPGASSLSSVDFDPLTGAVYVGDNFTGTIMSLALNSPGPSTIVTLTNGTVDAIALDPMGKMMYWTNIPSRMIQSANMAGSGLSNLITTGLVEPRGIAVDTENSKMYWSDTGFSPKIEVADLDGSNRNTLIDSGLGLPHDLAIDYEYQRLYWTDPSLSTVEYVSLDGTGRSVLAYGVSGPIGIDVLGDYLYLTSESYPGVERMEKTTGGGRVVIYQQLAAPTFGVKAFKFDPLMLQ